MYPCRMYSLFLRFYVSCFNVSFVAFVVEIKNWGLGISSLAAGGRREKIGFRMSLNINRRVE